LGYASYWAKSQHFYLLEKVLKRLGSNRGMTYDDFSSKLHTYPALLAFYIIGITAFYAGNFTLLRKIFFIHLRNYLGENELLIDKLAPLHVFSANATGRLIKGMETKRVPINDWLFETIRFFLAEIIYDEQEYEIIFDRFECLISLAHSNQFNPKEEDGHFMPAGCFIHRSQNVRRFLKDIEDNLNEFSENSIYVKSNLLGNSVDVCKSRLEFFKRTWAHYQRVWR
jgi:hypothetical protein